MAGFARACSDHFKDQWQMQAFLESAWWFSFSEPAKTSRARLLRRLAVRPYDRRCVDLLTRNTMKRQRLI
ncbi:hypothetical protein JM93_00356 [Roseibium hamelinense]|uniref:Uncharacterized protein n=1 Tax=Roseibium hamelinense TaxID=150831 RepID=A0A562TGQ5_9HYPH|nr:hypothetical protein JM93_00356 [Roseibium hamelinense]